MIQKRIYKKSCFKILHFVITFPRVKYPNRKYNNNWLLLCILVFVMVISLAKKGALGYMKSNIHDEKAWGAFGSIVLLSLKRICSDTSLPCSHSSSAQFACCCWSDTGFPLVPVTSQIQSWEMFCFLSLLYIHGLYSPAVWDTVSSLVPAQSRSR